MAQTVNVTLCMDEKLNKNLEEICRLMGMDLTTMLMICCRKIEQDWRIPFEISAYPDTSGSGNNGRYSLGPDGYHGGMLTLD